MAKNDEEPDLHIRGEDFDIVLHKNLYDMYPEFFSMELHHSGGFTYFPGRRYIIGKKVICDWLNFDTFSISNITKVLERLGHDPKSKMFYHYKKPGGNLDDGLVGLSTQEDVELMLKHAKRTRFIEVYVEHEKTILLNHIITTDKGDTSSMRRLFEQNDDLVENDNNIDGLNETNANEGGFVNNEGDAGNEGDAANEGFVENEGAAGNEGDAANEGFVENEGAAANEGFVENEGAAANEGFVENEGNESMEDLLEKGDLVFDVDVDMSHFKGKFERYDVNWVGKGVETAVGELNMANEVLAIDFDEYDSGCGSDEEGIERKQNLRRLKLEHFSRGEKYITPPFHLGQTFKERKEIQVLLKNHLVETKRDIKIVKNDNERFRAVCHGHIPTLTSNRFPTKLPVRRKGSSEKEGVQSNKSNNKGPNIEEESNKKGETSEGKKVKTKTTTCPWTLHVSKPGEEECWSVKTFIPDHKCLQTRNLTQANSTFLSEHVSDIVRSDPDISGEALQDLLSKKFGITISKMAAYRAKEKAVKKLRGDFHQQFDLLRDYIMELKEKNPNTTVKLAFAYQSVNPASESRVFKRIYVCLGSLKQGFKELGREIIGLDGAFMKGPYPGQLLTAVSVDGNNGIYPVAYALMESECRNSWEWFLECLGDDLELPQNANFTFISDRQKGILQAINRLFPSAEHRFCLRHIHENLKSKFKGCGLRHHLWFAATRTTVVEFERAMEEIRSQDSRAYDWLRAIPAASWSRAHFSGRAKCDILLNNICESFNSKLVKGRDRPIISCLEFVREYLMKRLVGVQEVIDVSSGPLTPTATVILNATKEEACRYNVIFNGENMYQVTGPWNDQCVVNMAQRTCSCRKWQLTGIPCRHAVATLNNMHKYGYDVGIPEDWVHTAYTLETWKKVYSFKIQPIVGATYWPVSDCPIKILPPYHHTQVGRPKKKRKRSATEDEPSFDNNGKLSKKGKTVTCGKCRQKGHNSRACKGQSENVSQTSARVKKAKKPTQSTQPSESTQPSQSRGPSQFGEPSQSSQPPEASHRSQSSHHEPTSPVRMVVQESSRGPRAALSPKGKRIMVASSFAGVKAVPK